LSFLLTPTNISSGIVDWPILPTTIANPTINKALHRLPLLAVPVALSIAYVAKPTFLTHFYVSMYNVALKLS